MIDMYCTLFSLGHISLSVGPQCISVINACLSCAGSQTQTHLTVCFGYQLLHHSAISSTPTGVMMSIFCRCSSSSLKGFCSAYATCLDGAWYGLLSGFSYKENVPLRRPMPLKTLPNVLCIFYIISLLFLLSASALFEEKK